MGNRAHPPGFSAQSDWLLGGQGFQELVIKIHSPVKRVYPDAFVLAVGADIIAVNGLSGNTVCRQACRVSLNAVGGAGRHVRNHRQARPHAGHGFFQRLKHVRAERRRRK